MIAAIFFGAFERILPILQGQTQGGLMPGFVEETVLFGLSSDVMLLILPVLCTLPFTISFVEDCKSRFLRQSLPRSGRRSYLTSKILVTGISGGLVLFVGIWVVYAVYALVFKPMELSPDEVQKLYGDMMAAQPEGIDVTGQLVFAQYIGKAFVFFLCGFFWALVGSLFAALTMSKYMAYAAPFVLYFVLVILCERYFQDLYVLNPKEWILQAHTWVGGSGGVILFLGELIVVAALGLGVLMKKRMDAHV